MLIRKPHALLADRDPACAAGSARARRAADGAASPTVARILELQRTAGNRAVASALESSRRSPAVQRLDWEDAVDFLQWTNPLTIGNKALRELTGAELNMWGAAEQAVRLSASKISIPEGHVTALKEYAKYNAADGEKLLNALNQRPSHYTGGLLLGGNKKAAAITFGNSVFYGEAPDEGTFVHEMVHVNQYHKLGRKAFVLSYFGMSIATIAWRAIRGQPIAFMQSSPHEAEAYNLEKRFAAWFANKGK